MAIIYSYPRIGTLDLQDLMIISDVQTEGNPTKSVTLSQLTAFIKGTPTGGLGTTNYIPKWVDGPNSILGDSPIFTIDGGAGLKQAVLTDGYRFVVDRDAATTVGDPEYAITQNGINKTSFGWDDDGGGFGFIYNWEGKGFKIGGAALYPQFEILTDPDIKNITFADFEFEADIIDVTGNVGNAGEVLSSLGAGNGVQWVSNGGTVTGTGTTQTIPIWTDGPNGVLGDSNITDDGVEVIVGVDFRVDGSNTDIESTKLNMLQGGIDLLEATATSRGITFTHPAGGASADVNLYFAGAGAGSRFVISRGATGGPEIELEAGGNVNINRTGNGNFFVGGEVTFDDYGSGTITGTPTFNLEVDANGKIIETAGGAGGIGGTGTINAIPKFTAANVIGDSNMTDDGGSIEANIDFIFSAPIDVTDVLRDVGGNAGTTNQILTSVAGTAVEWRSPQDNTLIGYKSVQVFQWPNGTPVAYTNWTNGVASNIPFNNIPLVETGNYTGTAAQYAWTCINNAGGTATQEAQFTLGGNGAGTWQIETCQHWFDQTNQVEIRVSFQATSGAVTTQVDVIDEKSTELSGDKIFYGTLVREFAAGDKLEVDVEFVSGGVNPFPSDAGNRPIEITFTKLV